jgi:release factor glutamine methyltransferase
VVAVDISPEAVRCARINVLLNRVEDRVEVRCGDLFEPVCGERFDLVLFNPPFYAGTPRELWEFAWRAQSVLDRFARDLPSVLTPSGHALVVVSTTTVGVDEALARYPLQSQVLWSRAVLNERLMVLQWTVRSTRAVEA